jgi:hypothetical protein
MDDLSLTSHLSDVRLMTSAARYFLEITFEISDRFKKDFKFSTHKALRIILSKLITQKKRTICMADENRKSVRFGKTQVKQSRC